MPGTPGPAGAGRRQILAFADEELGARGTIVETAWGPHRNETRAATYPRVVMRMGYQRTASVGLAPVVADNYAGAPQVVYDGPYAVAADADVGDSAGHPAFSHAGGYAEGAGCEAGGTWNEPAYTHTGFVPWPTFSTAFRWDPGDPLRSYDSVLLFDVSVAEGGDHQLVRSWRLTTTPCSGVRLSGFPKRSLHTGFEGEQEEVPTQPIDAEVFDTRFTVVKQTTIAQSLFYMEPGNPIQAAGGSTFGALSDYIAAEVQIENEVPGTEVEIWFQGAQLVEDDRRTINLAGASTPWTMNIDDCDRFAKIRWRVVLRGSLTSGEVPEVRQVQILVQDDY